MGVIPVLGHRWRGGLALPERPEVVALAGLVPLLTGYGLTAELAGRHQQPVLVVTNHGGPQTAVYLADHPVWAEPAVHGFVDLCLGPLSEPGRVAARLAWLLGVVGSRHRRINPAQEGVGHDT